MLQQKKSGEEQDGQHWSQQLASTRKPKESVELRVMDFGPSHGDKSMRTFWCPVAAGLIPPKLTTQHDPKVVGCSTNLVKNHRLFQFSSVEYWTLVRNK